MKTGSKIKFAKTATMLAVCAVLLAGCTKMEADQQKQGIVNPHKVVK